MGNVIKQSKFNKIRKYLDNTHFSKKYIKNLIKGYYVQNPQEDKHSKFKTLLSSKQSLTSRKNFFGHITASAIVLDQTLSKVLLVEHKSLRKFVQPGGHIEESDSSILSASMRELSEETRLVNFAYIPLDEENKEVPFDIDVHVIPGNEKKGEPEHLHFDFRYLFVLTQENQVEISKEEINCIVWKDIKSLEEEESDLSRVAKKLINIVSLRRDEIFFRGVLNNFSKLSNLNIVVISHIVSDIIPFIYALKSVSQRLCIIPKPNSISSKVLSSLPKGLIYPLNRDQLKERKILNKIFPFGMKSCVIDIGGYFATNDFFEFNNKEKRVVGIVEDTENGLLKYKKLENNVSLPVFSVARSELKRNEDDLVGYSVAYYTEAVLRKSRILPRYFKVGIIGYGKLGRGVAKYFFNQNVKPLVYDTNLIKLVESYKDGCIPVEKDDLLSNSDIIICATGSQSIEADDFSKLKTGSYISSVTSSEDEFDLNLIDKNFYVTKENEFVKKFSNQNNYWYLINNGNAVNFIDRDGDRVGDFIRLVQGEIIIALSTILKNNVENGLREISHGDRKNIAKLFIQNYLSLDI